MLMLGKLPARETAYLYMEKYQKLLEARDQMYAEYEGRLMYYDIQREKLLSRIHYLLNEAEGRGVILDDFVGGSEDTLGTAGDDEKEPSDPPRDTGED